ncbi:hypothetical protein DNTS_027342, partial [Danionella cerebrum]
LPLWTQCIPEIDFHPVTITSNVCPLRIHRSKDLFLSSQLLQWTSISGRRKKVTAQIIWEGLWMNCVMQSTGQMQCKIYDSLLALPQDLQAARALVVIAIIICIFALILGIAGGKCTNFVEEESTKAKITITSGVIFIVSGVLVLVPVCWSANTIIRDFYNPILTDAQRREMGASLYIGWGVAALLILGGAILCSSCPRKEDSNNYGIKYSQPRSVATSKAYV